MLSVGSPVFEDLAKLEVSDASGRTVRLGSFWRDEPCLLVFVRHFGCVGCGEQVSELSPRLPELERAGVRVVLIGNGDKRYIEGFSERYGLADKRVEVVTDPSLASFRAAGLQRSWWATHGARAMLDTARGMAKGIPHRAVEGDSTQQGGVLLVDGRGVLRFYHRNESIGDHPTANELVEAALVLSATSAAVRV
jgi:peroxiredoxin